MNDCNCNNVSQRIDSMNKTFGATVKSPVATPQMLTMRGVITAGAAADVFLFKRDSLGISAVDGSETSGTAFTFPVGFSVGIVNTWLATYALVIGCMNQQVSDANQLGNSLRNFYKNPDGDSSSSTTWAPTAQFASNQNANLLNVGQPMVMTNQSFLRFPVTRDAVSDITVTITFKGIVSVPYSELDEYLNTLALRASGTSC